MLTQKDQRIIRSRLDNIYKIILSKKDIDYFENEIVQTIKNFNKKNPKKKKNISEKTTLVICYGDSVYSEKKKSIRVFRSFFQKKLKKSENRVIELSWNALDVRLGCMRATMWGKLEVSLGSI